MTLTLAPGVVLDCPADVLVIVPALHLVIVIVVLIFVHDFLSRRPPCRP